MEEKYLKAKEKLEKYGQEKILNNYERLSDEKKKELLEDILGTDFGQVNELYKEVNKDNKLGNLKIEPISYVDKSKLSEEERKYYDEIGEKVIKNGEYAVVTMAGGQGTRLGHSGPKGTYDIGLPSHKSIFEILSDTIKSASQKYNVKIQWYIMTSRENNKATIEFFESKNYFDYGKENIIFFIQGELPMLDNDGKVFLDENGKMKKASDGHGGIFSVMRTSGVIDDMKRKNIKWIYIGGVDNILAKMVDSTFVGLAIDKKVLAAGKSLVKACPEEKVGVFCKKNGRPGVVEYTEISKEMSEETDENGELKYGESHILCNLFNIEAIEKMSKEKTPYHVQYKKSNYIDENGNTVISDKPNAYKFEAFIFDFFEKLDDIAILRVKREEEFAPIKNKEGVDSPETARKMYIENQKQK